MARVQSLDEILASSVPIIGTLDVPDVPTDLDRILMEIVESKNRDQWLMDNRSRLIEVTLESSGILDVFDKSNPLTRRVISTVDDLLRRYESTFGVQRLVDGGRQYVNLIVAAGIVALLKLENRYLGDEWPELEYLINRMLQLELGESKLLSDKRQFERPPGSPVDLNQSEIKMRDISSYLRSIGSIPPAAATMCGYEMIKQIGSGSFSNVYSSKDPITGEPVAIKIQDVGKDASDWKQFLREASVLSAVARPIEHVTRAALPKFVVDCPEDKNKSIIVMPMADTDLDTLLANPKFSLWHKDSIDNLLTNRAIRLKIASDLVCQLANIHSKRIAHNDLKPENILIFFGKHGTDISQVRAEIGDFGIAEYVDGKRRESSKYVGTKQYSSPEKLCGIREYGQAADVWALGLILAELLIGLRPFMLPNYDQLIASQFSSATIPMSEAEKKQLIAELKELEASLRNRSLYKPEHAAYCIAAIDRFQDNVSRITPIPSSKADRIEWMYSGDLAMRDYLSAYYGARMYRDLWQVIKGMTDLNPSKRWTMDKVLASPPFNTDQPWARQCPPQERFTVPFTVEDLESKIKAAYRSIVDSKEEGEHDKLLDQTAHEMAHGQFLYRDVKTNVQQSKKLAQLLGYNITGGLYSPTPTTMTSAPSGAKRRRGL